MREPDQRPEDSTLRATAVAPSLTCHSHTFILAALLDIATRLLSLVHSSGPALVT